MKILPLLLVAFGLSACESTSFEKPPIADGICDARLVGHWESISDNADENGDVQLDIGADCRLEMSDKDDGRMREGEATQLHAGALDGKDYLWVDSDWSLRRFKSDLQAHAGDVTVLRYIVQGPDLTIAQADHKAIAHRILDDQISGEARKDEHGLQNRITGGPHPDVLSAAGFFGKETGRFRRTGTRATHDR